MSWVRSFGRSAQQVKVAVLVIFTFMFAEVFADPVENHAFLYGFLAGEYLAIGQRLNSNATYRGKVSFSDKGGYLEVIRSVDGIVTTGRGEIRHALGLDQANLLSVHFVENGEQYEAIYLWRADLDNYARLSGYIHKPGFRTNSPGLEALFVDHTR